jgi:cysteine-S-conjugate beta-lyase
MKKYNFDEFIERRGTDCVKYDHLASFGNADALPLWVADTDFRVADFIVDAIRKRMEHEILAYSFRPESYYAAIINWLQQHYQWSVEKEDISSSPGVVAAVTTLILALSEPGDKVVVQPPVYFPFFTCVKGTDRTMVENPLMLKDGRYYFDFDDLKKKLDPQTKLLILCNPHNPGGMVWTRDELEELGRICLENGTMIISDEIHSDLVFEGYKHLPLPMISEELAMNCAVCMAPNKTFNIAGLATAFVVIPNKKLRVKYERWLNVIHIHSGNIFGNVAMEAAYAHGSDWVRQLMEYLEENRRFLTDFISNNLPKVKMMQPEATFLAWLDFREYGLTEHKLVRILTDEAGVVMNKGSMFGTGGEGFFRINFGCPKATLEDGLKRIAGTMEKYS